MPVLPFHTSTPRKMQFPAVREIATVCVALDRPVTV
jgi:hypothetical protein